ncbi:hypothetical protein [Bacillus solimangrovi]|nr:hypothetical protein [Bacillus solimangrovi]
MNKIIERYDKDYDFIYLFSNDTVLDLYPKFGFEKVKESWFSLKTSDLKKQTDKKSALRKLEINKEDSKPHIFDIISKKRVEIDTIFNHIISANIEVINFYFTPDYNNKNIHTEFVTASNDILFVLPLLKEKARHFLFPLTSHS